MQGAPVSQLFCEFSPMLQWPFGDVAAFVSGPVNDMPHATCHPYSYKQLIKFIGSISSTSVLSLLWSIVGSLSGMSRHLFTSPQ